MEENMEDSQSQKGCKECCERCVGSLPWASLIATILLYMGVALFCGCSHEALSGTVTILQNYFEVIRAPGDTVDVFTIIDILKYIIYGLAAGFFILGVLLLVEGFFTTGAIRELYGEFKISACGRCLTAFVSTRYVTSSQETRPPHTLRHFVYKDIPTKYATSLPSEKHTHHTRYVTSSKRTRLLNTLRHFLQNDTPTTHATSLPPEGNAHNTHYVTSSRGTRPQHTLHHFLQRDTPTTHTTSLPPEGHAHNTHYVTSSKETRPPHTLHHFLQRDTSTTHTTSPITLVWLK
uniref:Neuronal membrane glycoprotein M6-a n=1 Tax=Gouania willdenowi TaxID=441366 RepID=A0A8C5D2Y2_GOUWI